MKYLTNKKFFRLKTTNKKKQTDLNSDDKNSWVNTDQDYLQKSFLNLKLREKIVKDNSPPILSFQVMINGQTVI